MKSDSVVPPIEANPDNVVALPPERVDQPRPLLTLTPRPGCFPHTLVLGEKTHTVTCSRCDKALEPFEALLYIVRRWGQYALNLSSLRRECEALVTRRDALR